MNTPRRKLQMERGSERREVPVNVLEGSVMD